MPGCIKREVDEMEAACGGVTLASKIGNVIAKHTSADITSRDDCPECIASDCEAPVFPDTCSIEALSCKNCVGGGPCLSCTLRSAFGSVFCGVRSGFTPLTSLKTFVCSKLAELSDVKAVETNWWEPVFSAGETVYAYFEEPLHTAVRFSIPPFNFFKRHLAPVTDPIIILFTPMYEKLCPIAERLRYNSLYLVRVYTGKGSIIGGAYTGVRNAMTSFVSKTHSWVCSFDKAPFPAAEKHRKHHHERQKKVCLPPPPVKVYPAKVVKTPSVEKEPN